MVQEFKIIFFQVTWAQYYQLGDYLLRLKFLWYYSILPIK